MTDKAALRKTQRARVLEPDERARQSERLRARLLSLDLIVQAEAVALFVGVRHEPSTRDLFDALAPKKRWLPRVIGDHDLAWVRVEDWSGLVPSRFGIPEPPGPAQSALPAVDVVLVPGLAFDARGGRLGHGRGYYDRVLAASVTAKRVGVCLSPGLVQAVPMDAHDVPMDVVVTPDAVYGGENTHADRQ